jgi:hypothetical protein
MVTMLDGREMEIEIATKAQKLRWRVDKEF